jgi:hypothetical protein
MPDLAHAGLCWRSQIIDLREKWFGQVMMRLFIHLESHFGKSFKGNFKENQ